MNIVNTTKLHIMIKCISILVRALIKIIKSVIYPGIPDKVEYLNNDMIVTMFIRISIIIVISGSMTNKVTGFWFISKSVHTVD